jgi:hypothetical protein
MTTVLRAYKRRASLLPRALVVPQAAATAFFRARYLRLTPAIGSIAILVGVMVGLLLP